MGAIKREDGQVARTSIKMHGWKAKFSFSRLRSGGQETEDAPRTSLKVGIVACSAICGI